MLMTNVLAFLLVLLNSIYQNPLKPITVCEALADRINYNGKMITVVGRLTTGEEFFHFEEECAQPLKTGPISWRNYISFKYESHLPTALEGKFEVEPELLRDALLQIMRTTKIREEYHHWAIVYGRFETRAKLEAFLDPRDGMSNLYDGFGHLGFAPAQIVYRKNDFRVLSTEEVDALLKKVPHF
jgi:hypothetical protein